MVSTAVYAVPDGPRAGNLYAWLPPQTAAALETPSGQSVLQHWILGLLLPPGIEDALPCGDWESAGLVVRL